MAVVVWHKGIGALHVPPPPILMCYHGLDGLFSPTGNYRFQRFPYLRMPASVLIKPISTMDRQPAALYPERIRPIVKFGQAVFLRRCRGIPWLLQKVHDLRYRTPYHRWLCRIKRTASFRNRCAMCQVEMSTFFICRWFSSPECKPNLYHQCCEKKVKNTCIFDPRFSPRYGKGEKGVSWAGFQGYCLAGFLFKRYAVFQNV